MMKMGQQPLATTTMVGADVGLGEASPTYGLRAKGEREILQW